MSKEWKGQRYNTDWVPIDAEGNATGEKDWAANREWDEQNAPGGAWNFSPTVMAANPVKSDKTRPSYGTPTAPLPAPGSGAAGAAPYGTLPNNPAGTATPYGGAPGAAGGADPAWMNWQPPNEDAQALGNLLGGDQLPASLAGTGGVRSPEGPYGPPGWDGPMPSGGGAYPQQVGGESPSQLNALLGGTGGVKSPTGPLGPPGWDGPMPNQPPNPSPTPTPSGGLVTNNRTGSAPPPGAAGGLENTLYSSLTQQIGAPTTVDRTDPAYQQQVDAYNANAQRGAERQRAVAAQRAHAGGTDASGGFDGTVNRLTQDQGLNESAFEAQLMDAFRTQNLDRQGRAQQIGAGLVGMDKQLGQQESQFGRQLGQNESQFGRQLGQNESQFGRNLGQQESQFGRQLGQNESQFGRQLGQQNTQFNTGQRNNLWTSNQSNRLQRELGLGDLNLRTQGLGLQRELGLGDLDYRRDALGQNLALSQAGMNRDALMALLNGF